MYFDHEQHNFFISAITISASRAAARARGGFVENEQRNRLQH
jgi:hypothetical protein